MAPEVGPEWSTARGALAQHNPPPRPKTSPEPSLTGPGLRVQSGVGGAFEMEGVGRWAGAAPSLEL